MNILAHIFLCLLVSNSVESETVVALCVLSLDKLLSREVKLVYASIKSLWELWIFFFFIISSSKWLGGRESSLNLGQSWPTAGWAGPGLDLEL